MAVDKMMGNFHVVQTIRTPSFGQRWFLLFQPPSIRPELAAEESVESLLLLFEKQPDGVFCLSDGGGSGFGLTSFWPLFYLMLDVV